LTSTEGPPSLQKRRAHTNTNEQLLVAVYYWLRNQPRVEYCQEGTGRNRGLSEEIPPFTDVSERSLSIFFRDCLGSYLQGLLALRVVMWAATATRSLHDRRTTDARAPHYRHATPQDRHRARRRPDDHRERTRGTTGQQRATGPPDNTTGPPGGPLGGLGGPQGQHSFASQARFPGRGRPHRALPQKHPIHHNLGPKSNCVEG